MNPCRLCSDIGPRESWNKPLFESANFIVLPSVGALVEGWLLLLPKKHIICIGALPNAMLFEMEQLKERACSFLRSVYGEVSSFEHGPHRESLSVGCGVDHAHLHLAPISFDLRSAAIPFVPGDLIWCEAVPGDCRKAFNASSDYLFLEQPSGNCFIARHANLGSQVFRRAIAAELGVPHQYNWKEFAQLANVERTIARARSWKADRSALQSGIKAVA
jgi:diadenosine tetraphosphate (Ap4A) HIT family hydrolase